MRKALFFLGITIGLSIIGLLGVHPATAAATGEIAPRTLIVASNGQEYASIQAAIEAAQPGDTVLIKAGTYRERVVLNKPLKLIGEDYPVVDGSGQGDVITVLAGYSTIQGLVITNGGYDLAKDESGVKLKSDHNLISGNKVLGNSWGIYLYAANDNVVSRNFIKGKEIEESKRGNGIHLWKSERNTIDNNELTANRDAMYFSFAKHNTISNNVAYGQRYGIHYMYSDNNKVEHNVLHDNAGGIAMMYSKFNEVRFNETYRNTYDGILGRDVDDTKYEGNIIYNNRQGFFMYNTNRNAFTNNVMAANLTGLQLTGGSDNNLFFENSWVKNKQQVKLLDPVSNRWDNGQKGNYWSDYTGYDLDNNGYGDSAYWQNRLVEYLVEKFPLVKLLFNSPAMQAIEAAEKAFPVLHPPGVVDKFPLIQPVQIDLDKLDINWQLKFSINPSEEEDNSRLND